MSTQSNKPFYMRGDNITIVKRTMLLYLIGIVLLFFVWLFFGEMGLVVSNKLWIIPAIFNAFALLLATGIYLLLRRPSNKKKSIFLITNCVVLILMISIAVVSQKQEQYRKTHANIEDNHNVMKYFVNDNEEYIRIGFYRLESEFKNPNEFRLDAFSVRKRDTIINSTQDTVYNIYFAYFLESDKANKYFSKVSVLAGTPALSLFNVNTELSEEYSVIKSEKAKSEREAAKTIKEAFRRTPDSTKEMIKKAFSE